MFETNDIQILMRSRIPLIVIETHEEPRAIELFKRVAVGNALPLYRWSTTQAMQRIDVELEPVWTMDKPQALLKHIHANPKPGIYLLLDFHPWMDDAAIVRLVKDIALKHGETPNTLVFISHRFPIPPEIEKYTARFELSLPSSERLVDIVREEARAWAGAHPELQVHSEDGAVEALARNLAGLSVEDARRLARQAIADDGALTHSDLTPVMEAKYQLLARDGALSFEYDTARFSDVGGMGRLKTWLEQRKRVFLADTPPPGLDPPKGIMLLGVQGCGKSLSAKAIAGVWGVPLLRLDGGALYDKYIGQTEKNLREALKTAEVMAPCVLWIDEIEKALAVGDSDGGTSRRVLGTLLTWMAERRAPVFLAVTANDIQQLPPELIRKGRLDEIFFVDLPDADTRKVIFDIHLRKRGADAAGFDLDRLAAISEGFSGAEIEQAVVAAFYAAHARDQGVSPADLAREIVSTRPLSVVMAEKIDALRAWAASRTVPVN
ncbi:MAG: AAA family ATPase [Chromatiales bacterium]|nr:AAA family ATPase [Chromatiales bacterium]